MKLVKLSVIFLYFSILGFRTLTPLEQLIQSSADQRFDELKYRFVATEWDMASRDQRLKAIEDLNRSFKEDNHYEGQVFTEFLIIFQSNLNNDKEREKAKKDLSLLKSSLLQTKGFLSSLYYFLEGRIFYYQQERERAVKSYIESRKYLKGVDLVFVNYDLAYTYNWLGKHDEALKIALENQILMEESGLEKWKAKNYLLLGKIYMFSGQLAKAIDSQFKALEILEKQKNYGLQVSILIDISINKFDLGLIDESIKYLYKAEQIVNRESTIPNKKFFVYFNLSSNLRVKGDLEKSEMYAIKSIEVAEQNKMLNKVIFGKLGLAIIRIKRNQVDQALKLLKNVETIDKEYWNHISRGWHQWYMAQAYFLLKNYKKAAPYLHKAIEILELNDSNSNILDLYQFAATFYKEYSKPEEANKYLTKYYELLLKTEREKNEKLLYSKENRHLALKNREHELVLESQKSKMIMLVGFILAFFVIVALQFNRNRIIKGKNLELARKEAVVREKTDDLQGVLDNIHQGVVTLDLTEKGGHKVKDVSKHFFMIFEHLKEDDVIGSSNLSLFFENSNLTSESLSTIQSIILSSAHEDQLQWDVNCDLLPKEMILDEYQKIIELDWATVTRNDLIQKIIITFKDVTEIRKLGELREKDEENTQKLVSLALMDQKEYFSLVIAIERLMTESFEVIQSQNDYLKDALDLVFRNLHTIKGLARSYDFHHLSSFTHQVENIFQDTRNQTIPYDRQMLMGKLNELHIEIESYREIAKAKLKWDDKLSMVTLPVKTLTAWYGEISKSNIALESENRLDEILLDIKKRYSTTLEDTLQNIIMNTQKLSKELDKGALEFVLEGCDVFVAKQFQDKISSIFVHLIRNSVDHGFVTNRERQKLKLPSPIITIKLAKIDSDYQVQLKDNGRGIALDRIKQKALEKNIQFNRDNHLELANLIFVPGFSTKQVMSEISGRGVGMDAVKIFLSQSGGDIQIIPQGDESHGYLPVVFNMTFPREFFDS